MICCAIITILTLIVIFFIYPLVAVVRAVTYLGGRDYRGDRMRDRAFVEHLRGLYKCARMDTFANYTGTPAPTCASEYTKYLDAIQEKYMQERVLHLELRYVPNNIRDWTVLDEVRALDAFRIRLQAIGLSFAIILHAPTLGALNAIRTSDWPVVRGINISAAAEHTNVGDLTRCLYLTGATGELDLISKYNIERMYCTTYMPQLSIYAELPRIPAGANISLAQPRAVFEGEPGDMLADTFVAHWRANVGYFKLQCSILYSIIIALVDAPTRLAMIAQWHTQYCKYYKYTAGDTTYYALDKDCRWFVRTTTGARLIQALEKRTAVFMQRALDRAPDPASIAYGMELYAYKPNLSKDVTWTTAEYNLPGFQYSYIRLKSLQRYTECYTMYESVFGPNIDLSSIKKIVSVGGGCGFEIIAAMDYFHARACSPTAQIIDIADSWATYADLIMCQYICDDVNNPRDETLMCIRDADLIIFGYVFKYLKAPFFTMIASVPAMLIFNERHMKIDAAITCTRVTNDIYIRPRTHERHVPSTVPRTFLSE